MVGHCRVAHTIVRLGSAYYFLCVVLFCISSYSSTSQIFFIHAGASSIAIALTHPVPIITENRQRMMSEQGPTEEASRAALRSNAGVSRHQSTSQGCTVDHMLAKTARECRNLSSPVNLLMRLIDFVQVVPEAQNILASRDR